jgi:uridylate kinase
VALRAAEIGADMVLKATRVDGIYDSDPLRNEDARLLLDLTYRDVLDRGLRVMDLTAITMCRENDLPIRVFNMSVPGNIARAVRGEPVGTLVH